MNAALRILAAVVLCISLVNAQELTPQEMTSGRGISIGPNVDFNLGLNISPYHVGNTKNNARPGSAFGVLADFPLTENTSLKASVQYYTIAFDDENTKIDNSSQNLGWMMITRGSFSYLSLRTMYQYKAVLFGIQAGLPVRAHVENCHAEPPVVPTTQLITSTSGVSLLVSALVGAEFPLLDTKSGSLHATVVAAFPFNQMVDGSVNTRPRLDDNFRVTSLSVSFAWMFSL